MEASELGEREQTVHAECRAKLKRATTTSSRVEMAQLPEGFRARALALLSSRGRSPSTVGEVRERELLSFTAPTALEALTGLRDGLV